MRRQSPGATGTQVQFAAHDHVLIVFVGADSPQRVRVVAVDASLVDDDVVAIDGQ
jgi:hypothetical protein